MTSTDRAALPGTPVDRAAGIVRAWVGCYTVELPAEVASARREMIEADLWDETREAEQRGEGGSIGRQRIGRLFRGIPADLTWRVDQWRGNSPRRNPMRISKVELIVLLGVVALCGIVLILGLRAIASPDPAKWSGWGPYGLVGGLGLSVVGLLVAIPRPSVGLALTIVGTVVTMAAMPWAFYIPLPALLVAWSRFSRSRSARVGSGPLG